MLFMNNYILLFIMCLQVYIYILNDGVDTVAVCMDTQAIQIMNYWNLRLIPEK